MLIYTIRRFLSSILVLLVVSFIVFMFTAETYDPLAPYRVRNPQPPKQFFDGLRHQLHLDQNVFVRYWNWLTNLIHFDFHSWTLIRFDFGDNIAGTPVAPAIAQRLAITSRLIIGVIILAVIIAVVGGVISGVRKDKPIDVAVTFLTFVLIALPTFWFAAVLKQAAINANNSAGHKIFDTTFEQSPGIASFGTHGQILHDQLVHLILPVVSLALLTTAGWIRFQRASTIEVLEADYMRLARAKGVRNRTVIRRHGLRNALIPLVTVMAIDIGALFGGAIITERVYVWHGMGDYLGQALNRQDTYAVVGWVMVAAIFVVVFNLFADLLYAVLDPRIRLA